MPASNRLRFGIGAVALAAFALSAQTPPSPPGTITSPPGASRRIDLRNLNRVTSSPCG